jgi:hypothetical protein
VLKCVECGATMNEQTPNWRAYIADPDEDDEGPFVVVYCPQCAAREFGPPRNRRKRERRRPPQAGG